MQDGNPAKRIEAVIALGVVRPQARPLRTAEEALKDKDSGVRQAACSTLGEMRSRAALPGLREALNDDAPEVVFAAAKALYAMNDPAGRTVLIGVLEGDRAGSSGFVSSSMREMKLKMHDPKALLLIGINQSAGLLGPFGMGIPIAERLMKDSQASGKTIAALLLATDRTEESKQALRTALEDKNWTVRVAAARAVALRDLTDLYKDVAPLLDDKRDEVRYAAAATLIRLRQAQNKTPRRKPGRS
ncbi:MAG TPA: HEAT repeat domain-containing protein [Bryobacteraceae bacterium]|nr:HEAT repeat domain-containing protein [Bryobacteraceae bacterium]